MILIGREGKGGQSNDCSLCTNPNLGGGRGRIGEKTASVELSRPAVIQGRGEEEKGDRGTAEFQEKEGRGEGRQRKIAIRVGGQWRNFSGN